MTAGQAAAMTTYRAYGDIPPGKSGMFKVGDTPRTARRVVSYARGLHYPNPRLTADGWQCIDCLGRLRQYTYRGVKRLRHAAERGVE